MKKFDLDDLLISKNYEVTESIDGEDFINLLNFTIDFYQTVEFKFNYGGIPESFETFLFKLNCKDNTNTNYGKLMLFRNNVANYFYNNKHTYRDIPFIQWGLGAHITNINEVTDEN